MRYRSKPHFVDAVQWTGTENSLKRVEKFMERKMHCYVHIGGPPTASGTARPPGLLFKIPHDFHVAHKDYIVRDEIGRLKVQQPNAFEAAYEKAKR